MTKTSPTHLPSLLSSLVFLPASALMFSISLLTAMGALFSFGTQQKMELELIIFSSVYGFEGMILGVITFFTAQKFFNKPTADEPIADTTTWIVIAAGVFVTALTFAIGRYVQENTAINWLLLPLLTIPAVAVPIAVLFHIAAHKISPGVRWQTWSIFGLSMTLAPFILLIVETAILLALVMFVMIYIVSRPDLLIEIERLSQQMLLTDPNSIRAQELLMPFITKPGTVAIVLLYISIFVPATEEMIKPLGVWLFGAQIESIQQGFVLGALSGAGYAVVETFGVSGQAEGWMALLFTRIGTGLLHITTSALMGAGTIAWRQQRRFLHVLGTYLLAVFLHGLWNTAAIAYSYTSLTIGDNSSTSIETTSLITMITLAIFLFGILFFGNHTFRKSVAVQNLTTIPAPEINISEERKP